MECIDLELLYFAFCSFNEIVKSDKSNLTNDIARGKWEKGRNVSWKGEIGMRNRRASTLVKIYNLENIMRLWGCRFSSGMTTGFIKRQIEGPERGWREGRRRKGRKGTTATTITAKDFWRKLKSLLWRELHATRLYEGTLSSTLSQVPKKRQSGWEDERNKARGREKSWGIGRDTRKRTGKRGRQ